MGVYIRYEHTSPDFDVDKVGSLVMSESLKHIDSVNFYNHSITDAKIGAWQSGCSFKFHTKALLCLPEYKNFMLPSETGQLVMILVAKYGLVIGDDYDHMLHRSSKVYYFQFKTLESFTIAALALK